MQQAEIRGGLSCIYEGKAVNLTMLNKEAHSNRTVLRSSV